MDIKNLLLGDFLEYAEEANGRSTVHGRDGLKIVQRRILYALGQKKGSDYILGSKVVGDVTGSYHPHGDASVYDALIRLGQPFKTRYPLVDISGNYGSIANPKEYGASRYVKMKLSPLGKLALKDIEKDTVPFKQNYDGTTVEPDYLPGLIPITLLNGTLGIGVGMASSIPPHNFREVARAIKLYAENPAATVEQVMSVLKGPDFPGGGTVINPDKLLEAYATGTGSVKVRCDYEVLTVKGRTHIVIKGVPFLKDPNKVIFEPLKTLYEEGYEYIEDVKNNTGKGKPFEIEVILTKEAPVFKVVETVLKATEIESSFTINFTTKAGKNKFKKQGILGLLQDYIDQNLENNFKAATFDYNKIAARVHILNGLIKATNDIDKVVETIKQSPNTSEASTRLCALLEIDSTQAKAILAMRLSQITKLDAQKIIDEKSSLEVRMAELKTFLESQELQTKMVVDNVMEIAKLHGDNRRTRISQQAESGESVPATVFLTDANEVYAIFSSDLPFGNRTNRGKKQEDNIISIAECSTDGHVWIATDDGVLHAVAVSALSPSSEPVKNELSNFDIIGKGVQLLPIKKKENIVMVTNNGSIKRTPTSEYKITSKIKVGKIREDDSLKCVLMCDDKDRIFALSGDGKLLNFTADEVNSTSINTMGVKLGQMVTVCTSDEYILLSDGEHVKLVAAGDVPVAGRTTMGKETNGSTILAAVSSDSAILSVNVDGYGVMLPALDQIRVSKSTTSKGVVIQTGNVTKILSN